MEALRQLDGAVVGAVCDEDLFDGLFVEMLGRQLAHLSGAEQKNLEAFEIAEDLLCKLHGGVRNRHGMLPDGRVRADPFRHAHRLRVNLLKETVQCAEVLRRLKCRADLPADLRLADDHRIETRGNAAKMLDNVDVTKNVKMVLQ